jgi:type II secretion system protein D
LSGRNLKAKIALDSIGENTYYSVQCFSRFGVDGNPFGFSQTGTMTISFRKFSIFRFLIGLISLTNIIGFALLFGQSPVSAQSPTPEPPKITTQPQTSEPTVYRVRSRQIHEIEKQLQNQFAGDTGFSITIKPDFEPDSYRVCVLAPESVHQKIPEILQQYAVLLPKNGGKSLVYIEPQPVQPAPVFQSSSPSSLPSSPSLSTSYSNYSNPSPPTPLLSSLSSTPTSSTPSLSSSQQSVLIAMPSAPPRQAETEMIRPAAVATVASSPPIPLPPVTPTNHSVNSINSIPSHNNSGLVQTLPQTLPQALPLPLPIPADSQPYLPYNSGNSGSNNQVRNNNQSGNEDQLRDSFTPTHVSMARIEQTIRMLLGAKIAEMSPNRLLVSVERNYVRRHCTLDVDRDNNRFLIVGDRAFCDQIVQLINAVDQPEPQHGWERRFVPIANVKPESIAKIMELCRSPKRLEPKMKGNMFEPVLPSPNDPNPRLEFRRNETHRLPPPPTPIPTQLPSPTQTLQKPSELSKTTKHLDPRRNPVIQLVGYQFENGGGGGTGMESGGISSGNNDVMSSNGQNNSGMEVVSDFRYQILPDLDVLIIDATGAEVARFTEMIRQIEELSKIAEPQIEVYYLKHVNCISLNFVISQVYIDLFRTKQGAIKILPMINPNAMLLVGWGRSMETMRDLIETLDKPVAVENSLLQVFRLKHASAQYALTVLRGTYPAVSAQNSAFAQRVQMFADSRTNAVIVQAGQNDMKDIERIIAEIDVPGAGPKLQIKPFKLKHTLAPDLAQVLNNAITSGTAGTSDKKLPALELLVQDEKGRRLIESGIMADVRISLDARNNTIIVTAPDHCMAFMEELIVMFDSPSATAEVKVFQILYGDANSMVNTLRSLIPTQLEGQVGPQLPGAVDEETLVPIRFAVDTRTNCILAAGAVNDLKIIEALLLSLDREDQQTRKQYVYELKSMTADAVSLAINEYIRSKRTIQQQAPGVVSPYQQIESEVIVIPETVSNSLIVSATPRYYDEILNLIKEIDKSPPQVVIQVLIGEVTLGDTNEFGAEFGIQDSLLFNRSTFSNITQGTRTITRTENGVTTTLEEPVITNGSVVPGWLFNESPTTSLSNGVNSDALNTVGNVGSQLLTNFATGRVGTEAGFGGLVFSANSDAISIMLRALRETNRIEILSRPQITAMNNQQAFIHVGQMVPRYNGSSMNGYTSSASVKDEQVGLKLVVKPNISPEGNVVMLVAVEKSKLNSTESVTVGVENGQAIRSAPIDKIFTMTIISAADNETVVLGGLISKENQEINRRVPLLSDIPILGKLFRYDYNKCRRTELLVMLTPRIVRNKNDMEHIKQIEAARMSWCLGNVTKLYGDIGTYNVIDKEPYTGDAVVEFPEAVNMENLTPLQNEPTPKLAPTLPTPILPTPILPTPVLPKKDQ